MKDFLEKQFLKVPLEYKDAFNERISQENYQRFLIFGTLFLINELITFLTIRDLMEASYVNALQAVLVIHALILLFFYYGHFVNKAMKALIYKVFFTPTLLMILGWTIWFTLIIQNTSDRITPYVLGLFMIAVVAYLPPLSILVIYNLCLFTFIYFLPHYQLNPEVLYPHYLNSFFLNAVAIMTSILFYRYLVKDFLKGELIKKHNLYLLEQSIQDTMTGLYNHQYSFDRLVEEIARSQRYHEPLSLILLDLDKFKDVNDEHGHQFGDYVIESFAKIMVGSLRHTDIIGRYGGEEFMIIMPNTSSHLAKVSISRLQKATEDYAFERDQKITFSGGLVTCNEDSAHELIEKADQLLYKAKGNGRNQVLDS